MKGLLIRYPWIEEILEGTKTEEYRGNKTTHRGEIALIQSGSGTVVGVCDIADVHGPLPYESGDYYATTYAWELANVRRLKKPVPYDHPSGAVIWVNLPEEVEKKIKAMLGEKIRERKATAVPSKTAIEKKTTPKRAELKENPKKKWKRAVTYRRRVLPRI